MRIRWERGVTDESKDEVVLTECLKSTKKLTPCTLLRWPIYLIALWNSV